MFSKKSLIAATAFFATVFATVPAMAAPKDWVVGGGGSIGTGSSSGGRPESAYMEWRLIKDEENPGKPWEYFQNIHSYQWHPNSTEPFKKTTKGQTIREYFAGKGQNINWQACEQATHIFFVYSSKEKKGDNRYVGWAYNVHGNKASTGITTSGGSIKPKTGRYKGGVINNDIIEPFVIDPIDKWVPNKQTSYPTSDEDRHFYNYLRRYELLKNSGASSPVAYPGLQQEIELENRIFRARNTDEDMYPGETTPEKKADALEKDIAAYKKGPEKRLNKVDGDLYSRYGRTIVCAYMPRTVKPKICPVVDQNGNRYQKTLADGKKVDWYLPVDSLAGVKDIQTLGPVNITEPLKDTHVFNDKVDPNDGKGGYRIVDDPRCVINKPTICLVKDENGAPATHPVHNRVWYMQLKEDGTLTHPHLKKEENPFVSIDAPKTDGMLANDDFTPSDISQYNLIESEVCHTKTPPKLIKPLTPEGGEWEIVYPREWSVNIRDNYHVPVKGGYKWQAQTPVVKRTKFGEYVDEGLLPHRGHSWTGWQTDYGWEWTNPVIYLDDWDGGVKENSMIEEANRDDFIDRVKKKVKELREYDRGDDHPKTSLSENNKKVHAQGGVYDVYEQTRYSKIKVIKNVITTPDTIRSKDMKCVSWSYSKDKDGNTTSTCTKEDYIYQTIVRKVELRYDKITEPVAGDYYTGIWQSLSVHCNKPDFDSLVASSPKIHGKYRDTDNGAGKNGQISANAVTDVWLIDRPKDSEIEPYSGKRLNSFDQSYWDDLPPVLREADLEHGQTYTGRKETLELGKKTRVSDPRPVIQRKTVEPGFYDKECPFTCTSQRGPASNYSDTNVNADGANPLNIGPPKNLERDGYGAYSGGNNGSKFVFFRDNVSKRVDVDVWYPTGGKTVRYKNEPAITTTVTRWAPGTPYLEPFKNPAGVGTAYEGQKGVVDIATKMGGQFTMHTHGARHPNNPQHGNDYGININGPEKQRKNDTLAFRDSPVTTMFDKLVPNQVYRNNSLKATFDINTKAIKEIRPKVPSHIRDDLKHKRNDPAFDGAMQGPTQKNWDSKPYSSPYLEIMPGVHNTFSVRATWPNETNRPQMFNFKYEYEPETGNQFPTTNVGFGRGRARVEGVREDIGVNIQGKCLATFNTTQPYDIAKDLYLHTGSNTKNEDYKLMEFGEPGTHKSKTSLRIYFARALAE